MELLTDFFFLIGGWLESEILSSSCTLDFDFRCFWTSFSLLVSGFSLIPIDYSIGVTVLLLKESSSPVTDWSSKTEADGSVIIWLGHGVPNI